MSSFHFIVLIFQNIYLLLPTEVHTSVLRNLYFETGKIMLLKLEFKNVFIFFFPTMKNV